MEVEGHNKLYIDFYITKNDDKHRISDKDEDFILLNSLTQQMKDYMKVIEKFLVKNSLR